MKSRVNRSGLSVKRHHWRSAKKEKKMKRKANSFELFCESYYREGKERRRHNGERQAAIFLIIKPTDRLMLVVSCFAVWYEYWHEINIVFVKDSTYQIIAVTILDTQPKYKKSPPQTQPPKQSGDNIYIFFY